MNDEHRRFYNQPDVEILSEGNIDNVARAVLALTREVAVLNDKVLVIEHLLETRGIVSREAIDTFEPDEAFTKVSGDSMAKILTSVIEALGGKDGVE